MDTLIRFHFGPWRIRGQIVRLAPSWAGLARRHRQHDNRDLPATVRDRLGELSAAGLLLAASLKFDGTLVLQIHGKGPVTLYVAECDADGSFRSTLKMRSGARVPQDASLADLVNQDGGGRFAVTLVPGKRGDGGAPPSALATSYQGIVPFEGDTVSEVLERYMARSEQIATRMWLAACDNVAFGLLLQRMPGEGGTTVPASDDDGWQRVMTLADTLTRAEMLEQPAATLLKRLFWDTPLVAFEEREPRFRCTCSREKVGAMLQMLGRDEVESIIADRGEVAVTCEFCNNDFRFDAAQGAALFAAGAAAGTEASSANGASPARDA